MGIQDNGGDKASQSLQDNLKNLENGLKKLKQPKSTTLNLNTVSDNICTPLPVTRNEQINLIMDWVQKVSGIKPDKRVFLKLELLFKEKNDVRFERLIQQLTALEKAKESDELLEIIEKLTVHETFFFREVEQLQVIKQEILPQLIDNQRNLPFPSIKILSAACSTGEEVYSIAILALEAMNKAGLVQINGDDIRLKPPWSLTISGIDISRQAINTAQSGRYDCHNEVDTLNCKNCAGQLCSFRSMPSQYFDYFSLHEQSINSLNQAYATIKPAIKRLVNFKVHNLTKPLSESNFDIIICRNVLIYFDNEKKTQAQTVLYNALKPNGVLLLGSSDTLLIADKFTAKRTKSSVYFQKK